MGEYSVAWLLFESLALTVFYHVAGFRLLKSYITKYAEKQEWWSTVGWDVDKSEDENFAEVQSVQEELKYLTILSTHHLIGGVVMTLGYLLNAPRIFVHGVLIEVADDIHDSLVLIMQWWPFNGKDTKSLMVYMIPHHLFGLLISFPMILNGWHKSVHAMAIGSSLLMAGGVSLTVHTIQRSQNRKDVNDAWEQYWIGLINFIVFTYCRFYTFPVRSYLLLVQDGVWGKMSPLVKVVFLAGTAGMLAFNFMVGQDMIQKLYKALKNARAQGSFNKAVSHTSEKLKNRYEEFSRYLEETMTRLENLQFSDVVETGEEAIKSLSKIELDFGDLEKDVLAGVDSVRQMVDRLPSKEEMQGSVEDFMSELRKKNTLGGMARRMQNAKLN